MYDRIWQTYLRRSHLILLISFTLIAFLVQALTILADSHIERCIIHECFIGVHFERQRLTAAFVGICCQLWRERPQIQALNVYLRVIRWQRDFWRVPFNFEIRLLRIYEMIMLTMNEMNIETSFSSIDLLVYLQKRNWIYSNAAINLYEHI